MKIIFLIILLCFTIVFTRGQSVIDQKGTRIIIDSSKWKFSGNNIYNKNSGNLGIGVSNPTAQLHTSGDIRFEGIGTNTSNFKILTADEFGNISTRLLSNMLSGSTITSMNGLTNTTQTFATGNNGSDFTISSLGSIHTFNLPNASAVSRGLLSSADWNIFNGKENVLTFSSGLTRTVNTINVNTTQHINALSNLTIDGFIKTTGGNGTLSIATISDFPILNQNTLGNAATVTTNANLTGPVTSVGNATSISSNAITNAMLSQVPSQVFKGRTSEGTGNVEDLTSSQATAMLNTFTSLQKGLVPASGGGTTTFLRADGSFAIPSVNSIRSLVTTTVDVINNSSTANTLVDLTGLSFNVSAGIVYHFHILIPYTSAASNNGSRWTIDAPASTLLNYMSRYTQTANSETVNYLTAVNMPSSCNNNSNLNGSIAIIEGIIKPSVDGTVQVRFASETANTAITAKAGASLEYW